MRVSASFSDCTAAATTAVAVAAVERGFRALALGDATLPDPMVVELSDRDAEVHVKGAHLKGGRHIVYPDDTPLTNLQLTLLDKMGVPIEKLGDSTGQFHELSEL